MFNSESTRILYMEDALGLKRLVLTGYAREEDLREPREEGILGVVNKPFTVDGLAKAVRRALDEK
ncbi:MAG: hypothetical protein ABIK79_00520 [Chloroflexota bacterium]